MFQYGTSVDPDPLLMAFVRSIEADGPQDVVLNVGGRVIDGTAITYEDWRNKSRISVTDLDQEAN
jgi:hypothetical protein